MQCYPRICSSNRIYNAMIYINSYLQIISFPDFNILIYVKRSGNAQKHFLSIILAQENNKQRTSILFE